MDGIRKWGPQAWTIGMRDKEKPWNGANPYVHPEYLKKVLFDLLERYKVDYQLYSPVMDVVIEGERVTAVVVAASTPTAIVCISGSRVRSS